jgi:hypothetical protein
MRTTLEPPAPAPPRSDLRRPPAAVSRPLASADPDPARPRPGPGFRPLALTLLALGLFACAPVVPASGPPGSASPPRAVSPAARLDADDPLCAPLLLEADPGFGTHVVLRRLPTAADFDDLSFITGLRQVIVALPEWPSGYADIRPIQQAILPAGTELLVLLPGWPPTREALGAWNLLTASLRVILVVDGPPADRALILELNRMRPLERVIAQMDHPSRSGFERLQRPLSFRVLRN